MITKAGEKRASYPMDFIPDKELFKAVMFARQMIKQGLSVDIACYRAATYYGFQTHEVAHYIGQRGGRSNAQKKK
jgi:hypothetical protein